MQTFDIVVIGGGPGGMAAGMMLNQKGKSVALIHEEQDSFGGVCLNRGCMPTKSLIKAATVYRQSREGEKYGLHLMADPVDLQRLRNITDKDLDILRERILKMMDEASVVTFRGKGSFHSAHEIRVSKADGSSELVRGEQIIIATGSESVELPFAPFDGRNILSSDQILANTDLPKKLLIIGGGAIGCEFATMYRSFGSDVVLVEGGDTLLPREDSQVGKALQEAFEKQGITVKTGAMIEGLTVEDDTVRVAYKGIAKTDVADKVLVGIGRKPNSSGLNLDAVGVQTKRGAVIVNAFMQTSVPHIYAIGDVIGGLMLAHAADKEGTLLATNLLQGTHIPLDETAVPRVAFCHPEVAAVGVNEAKPGINVFTMPHVPNGRSVVDKVAPAFVKLFVEEETRVIAGAVIIGEAATEIIHELALAVENRLTLEQVGKTIHAHPTHSASIATAVRLFH